jgi:cytochrome c biogenesis protein CcmG/thiol:disulfide interchange protein DsbE
VFEIPRAAVWLIIVLAAVARGDEPGRITVPLRLNRTVVTGSTNTVDFGKNGLPTLPGRVVTGRAPGGISVAVQRLENGFRLHVGDLTETIPFGGRIAVEAGGLPYVVQMDENALLWIPHYQAEGVLAVGPCRERLVVFDRDGNGRFDDLGETGSVGVDLYRDGRLRFGTSFEFCGRTVSAEALSADGSSITFKEGPRFVPQVGQPAPPVALPTLDDDVVYAQQRRPKPLLLDFWASWCSVCVGEFAVLRKFHESGSIQVVSVNLDTGSEIRAARNILRRENPRWQQVLTGQGMAMSAWQAFESLSYAGGTPLYVLIDERGVLRYAGTGGGPELPEIKAALANLF